MFWIGSACLVVLLFLLFYRIPVIELVGEDTAFFIEDDEFVLGWIHSIEKEEWFERYSRDNGKLVLTETYFKTFGAGTPYQAEKTVNEDGFVKMETTIDYEKLNITVSENVETTLFINGKEVPLYKYFNQYENVLIKVSNLSIWGYIRGDFV